MHTAVRDAHGDVLGDARRRWDHTIAFCSRRASGLRGVSETDSVGEEGAEHGGEADGSSAGGAVLTSMAIEGGEASDGAGTASTSIADESIGGGGGALGTA